MAKRNIAILSTILIVAFQLLPILGKTVYADTLVVPADDATHYYLYNHFDFTEWTSDDFLTSQNYIDYFNTLQGDDKTEVINKFPVSEDNYTIRVINDFIKGNYSVNQGFNSTGLYFAPIVVNGATIPFEDCKAFIGIFSGSGSGYILLTLYLYYCPNGDDFVYSGDTIYCPSQYYLTYQPFIMYQLTVDNTLHCSYSPGGTERITASLNSSTGYYQGTANVLQACIFCDFPYLFKYKSDYNSNLDTDFEVFTGYLNNNSLCVDRRTQRFNNMISGGGSVSPSQYGFKQNSFGNILYGDNTINQFLMVGYELNDISKTIGDKLYLKLNYRYLFSGLIHGVPIAFDETYYDNVQRYDLYPLNNNNYINVDLSNKIFPLLLETDSTFETNYATLRDVWEFSNSGSTSPYAQKPVPVSCDQMLYDFTTEHILTGYSMPVEYDTNFFRSVSLSYKGVTVSPTFNINTLWDGEFNGTYENRIDSAQIIVTESIYNAETGEESSPCTFIYDYLYGSYEGIGTLETIGDQLPSDKYSYGGQSLGYSSKEIGYNLATGDFYSSSAGGSSSSTGNVVNVYAGASSTGKVLIDIPFETAIANTPNLKQMYEDLKSGFVLSTTNSQSIIQLTRDTYTFIPAEIWGYIAITVVTCCGLAVYRNFRGR